MAEYGASSASQPLGLYAQSTVHDPYFYQPTSTVNLSGKIGNDNTQQSASGTTTASSLMASVTSAVESSYQSARNVVLNSIGGDAGAQGNRNENMNSSFSFFSLPYQQMINFAICILIGSFFMFLAFLFLPMVVFAPQKFVLLFTLGSLSWIAGLAMLQGPRKLLYAMVNKERIPVSVAYVVSMLGTFYATLFAHSYILTMLMAVIQIGALVAFIVSYFPGGPRMLSMVKDLIVDRIKGLVTGRGSSPGSTVLPL